MTIRKELRFGFALMALIIVALLLIIPWGHVTNGHLGLIMLGLVVVAIMLGFPTAFTLMGMGMFLAGCLTVASTPILRCGKFLT